ncbi:E3 ubiquitin-protein ligase RNF123-like isoform X1 [Macrobrachium rosenbergii]|uniref:E3 ubiquitin-protein ligase RNF123-like isoform X1 n=2 Tax=Macrobrachium rosenbergii TaxID=79674 RepID=UPI0034D6A699
MRDENLVWPGQLHHHNMAQPMGSVSSEGGGEGQLINGVVQYVFADDLNQYRGAQPGRKCLDGIYSESPDYGSVQSLVQLSLDDASRHHRHAEVKEWSSDGRLPIDSKRVQFDNKNSVGSFSFSDDRLGLSSQDNFSTIRANTCVYKGKWQYELMLGTKGVMQVGWATVNCHFSKEKGVGDTPDSYAYDGNRQRKWNVATYKYGAMWQCGDIISSTLDLDRGIVKFYRNGKSLGTAFENVKTGPGLAYFPAVSLALGENLTVNFGATPLRYPQAGYFPLESPPTIEKVKAQKCIAWLKKLVHMYPDKQQSGELRQLEELCGSTHGVTCLFIVAQHIATHLGPLLTMPYIVEACLVPALAEVAEVIPLSSSYQHEMHQEMRKSSSDGLNLKKAHILFDFLVASLEDHELLKCLENLIICLLTGHKEPAEDIHFQGQKYNLRLLYVLLSHDRLRKYCLNKILFDKVRFPSFVNVKIVDDEGLNKVVPTVWWSSKDGTLTEGDKQAYDRACNVVRSAVEEVEKIQIDILRLLLNAKDTPMYQDSSRALFLAKFRTFLKEHAPGSRVPPAGFTPHPVILCLFHRLLSIFHELWVLENSMVDVVIPPRLFYDGSLSYFDTHRLGGLESHLQKTLNKEILKCLPRSDIDTSKVLSKIDNATAGTSSMEMCHSEPSTSGAVLGEHLVSQKPTVSDVRHLTVTSGDIEDKPGVQEQAMLIHNSLLHLLDGIILLYHIGAHKQLGKVAAQRDSMNENVAHVLEIDKKVKYCREKNLHPCLLGELQGSRMVFIDKLKEQARQQAWVVAAVHSRTKHMHLISLMKVILTTLKDASKEGELFGFVPDFYVESLTEMCCALRSYFTEPPENVPECHSLLTEVGEFLALHFCDQRIVYADSKDSLIQALAGFVCNKITLTALENMPRESRIQMVRNLLQPYENRAWAQNNWILVRFWKGNGFGFRYTKSPHMTNKFGPKPAHSDNPNFTQVTAPCPSPTFQQHVVEVLKGSSEVATAFLNSLLIQLNWAFSEFIGMLQEIQNASNRPERVFIDSRQLRICATCFDLALALLRVLEMIVNIASELFTDFSRPNAESLLSRLCQLLCQVLHRVSGYSGCFGYVVSLEIPGLETIHHYPIITAVTGILVTLVKTGYDPASPNSQVVSKVLLSEPSFQLNSVYHLLGGQDAVVASDSSLAGAVDVNSLLPLTQGLSTSSSPNNGNAIKFSLRNYPEDVSREEIEQVEVFIKHLEACVESRGDQTPGGDDDSLCTICYAYPALAMFDPCNHLSCRGCVIQHLMNRTDCFFCKATINKVVDMSSNTFIYEGSSVDKSSDQKPK